MRFSIRRTFNVDLIINTRGNIKMIIPIPEGFNLKLPVKIQKIDNHLIINFKQKYKYERIRKPME